VTNDSPSFIMIAIVGRKIGGVAEFDRAVVFGILGGLGFDSTQTSRDRRQIPCFEVLTGYHIYRCNIMLANPVRKSAFDMIGVNVRHADLLGALGHLGQLCEVLLRMAGERVVEEQEVRSHSKIEVDYQFLLEVAP
jgi:hypothetical protein